MRSVRARRSIVGGRTQVRALLEAGQRRVAARPQQEEPMSLVRFNPEKEMEQMFERMTRAFNDSPRFFTRFGFGDKEAMTLADWTPAVDVQENAEAYLINAELPDVKKEDVKVSVQDGVLSLSGERRQEKEEKGKKFHRIERSYGRFQRSFALPDAVDEQKINASFKDGMLHVMIPKAPQSKTGAHEIKIG
jgi:HSP20 family protein